MSRLQNKKAFVTGGSRGIGAGIVRRFAREQADIAFTYHAHREAADAIVAEVKKERRRGLAFRADSADPAALSDAVERGARELGGIDIFVSSAGVLLFKPIEEFTLTDFEHIVAVDLRAAFVGAKAALPHMGSGGRIVFISSNIADYAALPTTSLYAMVKSGLDGLCKGMSRDLAPKGITVNTVHPGPIHTDANPENGPYGDRLRAFMSARTFGRPEDVAGLVTYLASDEAQFANGAAYKIDNTFTA